MKNENGFNLLELAAATAITAVLSVTGIATLAPLIEKFEEKAATIELQQQQQADELAAYLDSIAN